MEEKFDVIFFGPKSNNESLSGIKASVAQVLAGDSTDIDALFASGRGTVIQQTSDENQAKQLVQQLNAAGIDCNYRVANSIDSGTWEHWELEGMERSAPAPEHFSCLACGHAETLKVGEMAPETCPVCGVVQEKYVSVEARKQERELIRKNLRELHRSQQDRDERASEQRRLAGLRDKIAKEMRDELGQTAERKPFIPLMAAAVTALAVGISGTLLYLPNESAEPELAKGHPASLPMPASMPMRAASPAIDIANLVNPALVEKLVAGDAGSAQGMSQGWVGDPGFSGAANASSFAAVTAGPAEGSPHANWMMDLLPAGSPNMTGLEPSGQKFSTTDFSENARFIAEDGVTKSAFSQQVAQALVGEATRPASHPQPIDELFETEKKPSLERLKGEALMAAARAQQGQSADATRWLDAAQQTLKGIDEPMEKLATLPLLAGAYFEANDYATALALLDFAQHSLVEARESGALVDPIVEAVALAYAKIGLIEPAAKLSRTFFTQADQRDAHLARLASETAAFGHMISAYGLAALIDDNAQKSRTLARLSLNARTLGESRLAQAMLTQASASSSTLAPKQQSVVASELMRASMGQDDALFARFKQRALASVSAHQAALGDGEKRLMAENFAWVGDAAAAKQLIDAIDTPEARAAAENALQRIASMSHPSGIDIVMNDELDE